MWILMGSDPVSTITYYLASFATAMAADDAWSLLRSKPEEVVWYNGFEVLRNSLEITFVPCWSDARVDKRG